MILDLPILIKECAPFVGSHTIHSIIMTESQGNPYVIYDNTTKKSYTLSSLDDAITTARIAVSEGHNVDLGLMQINSSNLSAYNIDIENIFDPCTNISTGALILKGGYMRAVRAYGSGRKALLSALSEYNTGSLKKGFRNGYVKKILSKSITLRTTPISAITKKN